MWHSRRVGESGLVLNGMSEAVPIGLAPIQVSVRVLPSLMRRKGVLFVPGWAERHCTRAARGIARQRKVKLPATYEWSVELMAGGEGRLWLIWTPQSD